jgi:hypothetical protein
MFPGKTQGKQQIQQLGAITKGKCRRTIGRPRKQSSTSRWKSTLIPPLPLPFPLSNDLMMFANAIKASLCEMDLTLAYAAFLILLVLAAIYLVLADSKQANYDAGQSQFSLQVILFASDKDSSPPYPHVFQA